MLSENMKQRIVGGFVLLALALILFALLFDFSDVAKVDTRSQIPDSPDIAPVVVDEPDRPDNIETAIDDENIFQPEVSQEIEAEVETSSPPPPGLTEEGAYVRDQKGEVGELNRVFVGPKVLKSKLMEDKAAIDKKYGVNALMLHFDP